MIGRINFAPNAYLNRNVSFGHIDDERQDAGNYARSLIREKIEANFDSSYQYLNQHGHLRPDEMYKKLYGRKSKIKESGENKNIERLETQKANPDIMQEKLGGYYSCGMNDNTLIRGARLISMDNGIDVAKEAGIKTVLALEPDILGDYGKAVTEKGLNFVSLSNIGHKKIHIRSIIPSPYQKETLLDELIKKPEIWATRNKDGSIKDDALDEILDLQEFIDILDGKNKKYPLPIYYGCQLGTDRTFAWTETYKALKNVDRTKPLDEKTIENLAHIADLTKA